jgi:hypothetical protein
MRSLTYPRILPKVLQNMIGRNCAAKYSYMATSCCAYSSRQGNSAQWRILSILSSLSGWAMSWCTLKSPYHVLLTLAQMTM